jgi:hypothetical protein
MALTGLGGQAFASHVTMCAIQDAPAATLLLPYFEVDGGCDPNALTTLFSVNNASAAATVAHVTVWSNKSIPVFDFDIYLTGFDVQTVNLRDVLCDGNLPVTGRAPISNVGAFSNPLEGPLNTPNPFDDFIPTCGNAIGDPPAYQNPALVGGFLGHVQAWLTGNASPLTGLCASAPTGNFVGYLTIDDVHECNLEFPSDAGYFSPNGAGTASNHNVLWGDWFLVDTANNFAQGDTLVHIQAQDGFVGGLNEYTYYGRYTAAGPNPTVPPNGDNREPLATNYGVRHIVGGLFTGGTDLLVWRDSTSADVDPFSCATGAPEWEPLCTRQIVIFDEEENPVTVTGPPVSGVPDTAGTEPFPEETQRVAVGGADFPIPAGFEFGWLYLNLNHGTVFGTGTACFTNPFAVDTVSAQAWVSAVYSALGRFSIGLDAVQLDSACDPFTATIGTNTLVGPTVE